MDHCKERLLEWILDRRACINNLLESFFNEWRKFERMINRVMYTDSNTTKTATSGWIWQ
jgi:hypothetical protein